MRIKVCGITSSTQANELYDMQVEFAGFIFYPPSPRYVYRRMQPGDIKKIKNSPNKVGVFVNADPEDLLQTVDECGLHLVQLHGDESPRYCERIANYVNVVKAFRIQEDDNIQWKLKEYYDAVDMFMFDAAPNYQKQKGEEAYGGSGKKFNWELLKQQNIRKPFFLSGGITSDDVYDLKKFNETDVAKDLFAIDINSRFEIVPGYKDMKKIKSFVEEIKK